MARPPNHRAVEDCRVPLTNPHGARRELVQNGVSISGKIPSMPVYGVFRSDHPTRPGNPPHLARLGVELMEAPWIQKIPLAQWRAMGRGPQLPEQMGGGCRHPPELIGIQRICLGGGSRTNVDGKQRSHRVQRAPPGLSTPENCTHFEGAACPFLFTIACCTYAHSSMATPPPANSVLTRPSPDSPARSCGLS